MLTPQELEAHIKTNLWKMYSREMNELLQTLYTTIQLALSLGTKKLIIKPTQIIHLDKNDRTLFRLHSDTLASDLAKAKTMKTNYMETFSLMLSKDKLISEYFELFNNTPAQAEYIVKNG
jgi:hypothetical protein